MQNSDISDSEKPNENIAVGANLASRGASARAESSADQQYQPTDINSEYIDDDEDDELFSDDWYPPDDRYDEELPDMAD